MAIFEAKVKQHPEAELLFYENYSLSSSTSSSKKKRQKKRIPLFKCGYMINDNENEAETEK